MTTSRGVTVGGVFRHFGETTEGVQKGTKLVISGIRLAESIIECIPNSTIVTAPLKAARFSLTCLKDVAGATNVFGRAKDWLDDTTREGILKSTAKVVSRIFLLAAQTMEFVWFFVTSNALTLGIMTSAVAGSMPIFLFIKNLFYIGSATGSIVDSAIKISETSHKSQHTTKHHAKWIKREWEVMDHDLDLGALRTKYQEKLRKDANNMYYDSCLQALQGENPVIDYKCVKIHKRLEQRFSRLQEKLEAHQYSIEDIDKAQEYLKLNEALEISYTTLQKDQMNQGKEIERLSDEQENLKEQLAALGEVAEELCRLSLKELRSLEQLYLRQDHLQRCLDVFKEEGSSNSEKLTEYRSQIAQYRNIPFEEDGESFEKNLQIWSKYQVKKLSMSLKNERQGNLRCAVTIIAESMKIGMIALGFFLMLANPMLTVGALLAINTVVFIADSLQVTKMLFGAFSSPVSVPELVYA